MWHFDADNELTGNRKELDVSERIKKKNGAKQIFAVKCVQRPPATQVQIWSGRPMHVLRSNGDTRDDKRFDDHIILTKSHLSAFYFQCEPDVDVFRHSLRPKSYRFVWLRWTVQSVCMSFKPYDRSFCCERQKIFFGPRIPCHVASHRFWLALLCFANSHSRLSMCAVSGGIERAHIMC